jgi:hypothetical protein
VLGHRRGSNLSGTHVVCTVVLERFVQGVRSDLIGVVTDHTGVADGDLICELSTEIPPLVLTDKQSKTCSH